MLDNRDENNIKNAVRFGIGSGSYNNSGGLVETICKIKSQVDDEKKAGNKSLNHLLLRSEDLPNHLKFNLLIHGVPLFTRSLYSMLLAGLQKVPIVGNKDTGTIHNECFKPFFSLGNSQWIYEGEKEEWSRSNTIIKAYNELKPEINDLILEVALDTPFIDVKALMQDPANSRTDFLIRLNEQKTSGGYFPRNFHWMIEMDGQKYFVKEANGWGYNLRKIAENHPLGLGTFEALYQSRKTYGKNKSQLQAFADVALREYPRIIDANGLSMTERLAAELHNIKEYGRAEIQSAVRLYNVSALCGIDGVVQALGALQRKIIPALGQKGHLVVDKSIIERITDYASRDKTFKTSVGLSVDPGAIIDIDSIEDIVFVTAMMREDPSVYEHEADMQGFAKEFYGKWGIEFTNNSHEWLNRQCKDWGIDAEFGPGGVLKTQSLYSKEQIRGAIGVLKNYESKKREKNNAEAAYQ